MRFKFINHLREAVQYLTASLFIITNLKNESFCSSFFNFQIIKYFTGRRMYLIVVKLYKLQIYNE